MMKKLTAQERRRSQKRERGRISRAVRFKIHRLQRALFHRLPAKIRKMYVPIDFNVTNIFTGIKKGQSSTMDREFRKMSKSSGFAHQAFGECERRRLRSW